MMEAKRGPEIHPEGLTEAQLVILSSNFMIRTPKPLFHPSTLI